MIAQTCDMRAIEIFMKDHMHAQNLRILALENKLGSMAPKVDSLEKATRAFRDLTLHSPLHPSGRPSEVLKFM